MPTLKGIRIRWDPDFTITQVDDPDNSFRVCLWCAHLVEECSCNDAGKGEK